MLSITGEPMNYDDIVRMMVQQSILETKGFFELSLEEQTNKAKQIEIDIKKMLSEQAKKEVAKLTPFIIK